MKIYISNRRQERRIKLIKMSGGICEKCGRAENLEFNHKDRKKKLFDLSGKALDTAWDKVVLEWQKCELLCKECHLCYTKQQHGDKEIIPWNKNINGEHIHGTARTYSELNCRCSLCRLAKKKYRNKEVSYITIIDIE